MPSPRLKPIPPDQWTDEQRAHCQPIIDYTGAYNMLGTFLHHWEAFKARSSVPMPGSTIEPRLRELIILRVAVMIPCEYEWAQHKPQARRVGITDEEIERVKLGSTAEGWTAGEAAILDMADDLIDKRGISREVWDKLIELYDVKLIIDGIHLVGTYITVAMLGNSVDIEIERGLGFSGFDPEKVF